MSAWSTVIEVRTVDEVSMSDRMFLSGNEAVALAARDCGVALGIGCPGTPSTEILERFAALGGRAQWSPNEKVALEVAIGVAYAGAGALVTMKHVGLNVAADPPLSSPIPESPGPCDRRHRRSGHGVEPERAG